MTHGVGGQQTQARPSNLRIEPIEGLRFLQIAKRLLERAPFLRRLHQVQERPTVFRERSPPTLGGPVGHVPILASPRPMEPLTKDLRIGVDGAGARVKQLGVEEIASLRILPCPSSPNVRRLVGVILKITRESVLEGRALASQLLRRRLFENFRHVQVEGRDLRSVLSK